MCVCKWNFKNPHGYYRLKEKIEKIKNKKNHPEVSVNGLLGLGIKNGLTVNYTRNRKMPAHDPISVFSIE